MILNSIETGAGAPLVLLHGLFGAAQNWGGLAKRLGQRYRVLAFDARNHGFSPHAEGMDYTDLAADVAETMSAHGVEKARVVGHSMGGKIAMMLALTRPERVERLVVADIAPTQYRADSREYVAAMQAMELQAGMTRREAAAQLTDAVPEEGVRAFLVQNLTFDGNQPRWRVGLDQIAAGMPQIESFEPPKGARYTGPTLFIRGARSAYVREKHMDRIAELFPSVRHESLDTGHWVHAEDPKGFLALVDSFLS
jgi:esterase